MKKAILGGIAAVAVAGGLALAAPANAYTSTFMVCPSGHTGVVVGTPTSCPFADNVRRAWFNQNTNPVLAYSPVTQGTYWMSCSPSTETVSGIVVNGWTCYGGNDAEVVIW